MGLCVMVKEDQRIDDVFREFHMIVPLRGASILGKQGHDIWVVMPVSDMAGIQDTRWTWLHACPSCFFFFFLKNDGHCRTQLGHGFGPKKRAENLKCTSHADLLPCLLLLLA